MKKETDRERIMKITLLIMVLQRKRINRRDRSTERLNRGVGAHNCGSRDFPPSVNNKLETQERCWYDSGLN